METRCWGDDASTARLFQTITVGLVLLFAAWGGWLLLGDDPDGGAHAAGWFMLGVAAVLGLATVTLVSARRSAPTTSLPLAPGLMGLAAAVGIGALLLLLFGTP